MSDLAPILILRRFSMSVFGWRFRLLSVWKIPVLVHWSALARPAIYLTYWAIEASLSNEPYLELAVLWRKTQILLIVEGVLNASILVHELSHGFVTRFLGKKIQSIVLHGLGGICIFRDPEPFHHSPWRQLLVFGAGPASNLGLAGVALLLSPSVSEARLVYIVFDCALSLNLLLAILNLIPIFPLDGSRLLEALLRICGISSRRAETSVYAVSILLAPFLCHHALSNQDLVLALLSIILLAVSVLLVWESSEEDER
jgi:Zn-dependent protease